MLSLAISPSPVDTIEKMSVYAEMNLVATGNPYRHGNTQALQTAASQ
jgi:hypothetical protein